MEGQAFTDISESDALELLSFLNSSASQFILNLYSGQHKTAGYVNLLPFKSGQFKDTLVKKIIELKLKWSKYDETSLDYIPIVNLLNFANIETEIERIINDLKFDSIEYNELVCENDRFWQSIAKINDQDIESIKNDRPKEDLSSYISIDNPNNGISFELLQFLFGSAIGRWSLKRSPNEKFKYSESLLGNDSSRILSTQNSCLPFISLDVKKPKAFEQDIILRLASTIDSKGIEHILDLAGLTSLSETFENYNSFFDYHLKRYSKGRRTAPIYWPIATRSNSFIVWIYYPALNENTLFTIVNELVDPKIKETFKEVEVLDMKASAKELNDQKEFLAELKDFKEELLRVAQLPYKPNQDDGVLITAAPLHNLFRHTKWKRATQDCWKKLEKGEYDWAHLAYIIWPDRVANKCKKDLSMAIAHGLESICEIKPKEKKSRKKPEINVENQKKII
jgi:hypothetical protein